MVEKELDEYSVFFNMSSELYKRKINAEEYSPLNLAYIGDTIFDFIVRNYLLKDGNKPVNELNKKSSELVRAGAQACFYRLVEKELSDEEMSVMRRGRNTKTFSHAKNATIAEYRMATGVEALLGYLFYKERYGRIFELFEIYFTKYEK